MVERLQKKAPFIAAALVIALLSWLVVSGFASSTDFHKSTLAELEEKQTTVLELSAASAAASAAITLIPGDTATPIADKLADLSSYFLGGPLRDLAGKIFAHHHRNGDIFHSDPPCLCLVHSACGI